MEFIIVTFPTSRRVLVDGTDRGERTNETIPVAAGTHTITLGPPRNFVPGQRTIVAKDTNVIEPYEVKFRRQP